MIALGCPHYIHIHGDTDILYAHVHRQDQSIVVSADMEIDRWMDAEIDSLK